MMNNIFGEFEQLELSPERNIGFVFEIVREDGYVCVRGFVFERVREDGYVCVQ